MCLRWFLVISVVTSEMTQDHAVIPWISVSFFCNTGSMYGTTVIVSIVIDVVLMRVNIPRSGLLISFLEAMVKMVRL